VKKIRICISSFLQGRGGRDKELSLHLRERKRGKRRGGNTAIKHDNQLERESYSSL